MPKSKLVKRTYRIWEFQDEVVKKRAKKLGGQSAYIRKLIEKDKSK